MLLADKIHKIRENVDAINSFFKNYDKLEFKIINKGSIEVIAGSDLSVKYDIKIFFHEIYFMSTPLEWSSTPTYKFNIIKILQDESEINGKFYLEKGWFLFEFSSDAFPGCKNYITASSISYEINKVVLT